MRYEVLEKFFADTRLHLGLVHVSEQWVEKPLRQATGLGDQAPEFGGTRQWTYRQSDSRPAHWAK